MGGCRCALCNHRNCLSRVSSGAASAPVAFRNTWVCSGACLPIFPFVSPFLSPTPFLTPPSLPLFPSSTPSPPPHILSRLPLLSFLEEAIAMCRVASCRVSRDGVLMEGCFCSRLRRAGEEMKGRKRDEMRGKKRRGENKSRG